MALGVRRDIQRALSDPDRLRRDARPTALPCLLGLLLLLAVLDRFSVPYFTINPQHTSLWRALLAALTFHVNWLEARTGYLPANWDVLWSLSVEELFYVFFPLLCTLVRKQALLIALLGSLIVIGPYARVHTQNELWSDYGYLSCMDGIAFGCLAAMVSARIRLSRKMILLLGYGGALLCIFIAVLRGPAASLGLYKIGLDVTTLEIGTVLLMIALQQNFERQSREAATLSASATSKAAQALFHSTPFLRWFGRNSYEVYLTHMLAVWPMVILFSHFKQNINTAPLWFLATTHWQVRWATWLRGFTPNRPTIGCASDFHPTGQNPCPPQGLAEPITLVARAQQLWLAAKVAPRNEKYCLEM